MGSAPSLARSSMIWRGSKAPRFFPLSAPIRNLSFFHPFAVPPPKIPGIWGSLLGCVNWQELLFYQDEDTGFICGQVWIERVAGSGDQLIELIGRLD